MYFRLFFLIILIFIFLNTKAQTNINTNQVITYFKNGKIQKINNFRIDSCRLYDKELMDYVIVDTCQYGYFKEYYTNGVLKILGQYDCNLERLDTHEADCFKSGIWFKYDSLGKIKEITGYGQGGLLLFKRYPLKQKILFPKEDSIWIRLERYDMTNSYLIKRNKNNRHIFLKFYMLSDHSYWRVFDKHLNLLDFELEDRQNLLFFFKSDDIPTSKRPNQDYLDVAKLKSGRYYVYYNTLSPPILWV